MRIILRMESITGNNVVIFCIGSANVCGDSLGPAVGSLLIEKMNVNAYCYGNLKYNVNALNILDYISLLKAKHRNAMIIAVDACLTATDAEIGSIKVRKDGIYAGKALGKTLPPIGDVGIIGVVGKRTDDAMLELMSVPYELIEKMALKIADYIADYLDEGAHEKDVLC